MRATAFMIILIFSFFTSSSSLAQSVTYVSPGIKFGYTFGREIVVGAELSLAVWSEDHFGATGAVISFDLIGKNSWRLHAGVQGTMGIGASIGPTIQKHADSIAVLGWTATLFVGGYGIPYYSYTGIIRGGYSDYGLLIKLPIVVKGKPLELFNFKY